MIDVTNADKIKMVKKVYDLSRPQGLGVIHFTTEPLTDEEAKSLINSDGTIDMDYIKGRACKFNTWKEKERFFISDTWYDHTNEQFKELLEDVGLALTETGEHGCACNCDDCRERKGLQSYDPEEDFRNIGDIDIVSFPKDKQDKD